MLFKNKFRKEQTNNLLNHIKLNHTYDENLYPKKEQTSVKVLLFVLLVVNVEQLIRGHCGVLDHYHNIAHITPGRGEAQSYNLTM